MRTLLLFPLFLIPAAAQIAHLATDATGSTLLVRTQFRLQAEADVKSEFKIYRLQNGVWTRLGVAPVQSTFSDILSAPFLGAGGQVYGWHVSPGIRPPSMIARPSARAEVFGVDLPIGFPRERMTVSANGRYIAGVALIAITGPVNKGDILDTQTGARIAGIPASNLLVASDGTYAAFLDGQVTLVRPNDQPHIFGADNLIDLADDARWLAVRRANALTLLSATSDAAIEIAEASLSTLSNTRLLYVAANRPNDLMEFDLLGRQSTLLASLDQPITDIEISADGSVAWAVTDQNRLMRIGFPARGVEEILPPLGHSTTGGSSGVRGMRVPGSAVLLPGNFTPEQQVFVDNEPFPLSDVNAGGYWFQVPWEWNGRGQAPLHDLTVRTPGNPFEMVTGIASDGPFWPYFPTLLEPSTNLGTMVIAAHEDYSALVTPSSPARPGERIHVYMTGLGPLTRPVPTGDIGPADGVPISSPFACTGSVLGSQDRTPTQAAAFYAPTMIGIYVVELIVPADVPDGPWGLRCGDAEKMSFGWTFTKP